jgi:hypothetical protein
MALRRVSLRYLLTAAILSLGAALATFHLKYAVRDLDQELAKLRTEIQRESWAIQASRADLAFLTRPERLAMQAEQLGMVPARGVRLATVEQIVPWHQVAVTGLALTVALPSGAEVPLRFRPMPAMALMKLEKR